MQRGDFELAENLRANVFSLTKNFILPQGCWLPESNAYILIILGGSIKSYSGRALFSES